MTKKVEHKLICIEGIKKQTRFDNFEKEVRPYEEEGFEIVSISTDTSGYCIWVALKRDR